MPTINGKACVFNGTPVEKVLSNGGQVYGRNLLKGSAKFKFPFNNNGGTQTLQKYDDETNYIQYTSNTPSGIGSFWYQPAVVVGQVYTLSADLCGNGHAPEYSFRYEGAHVGNLDQVDLTDNWQRISNTFRVNAIRGAFVIYATNSTLLKIKHIKIEKGSVATPWTLAPEDVM